MTRTFIVAPQWIGDAVMTEPLLAALAQRGEVLTVAALPWVAPVYRAMAQVAEVIEMNFARGRLQWSARRELARSLQGRFDAAYVLPNSFKSALIPWFARIPVRVGYLGEGRWFLLNRVRPNVRGRPEMVPFYVALAETGAPPVRHERGVASSSSAPARFPRLKLDEQAAATVLQSHGLRPHEYWAFAPGAEFGPAKRWPAGHFGALAQRLHAETGLPVLLLGSGKDVAVCESIAQMARGACRVLAGQTSLMDAMALLEQARGIVSNDSGLMHVGAAFGVPQVAVFGSSSPLHTPPLNARARVIWLKEELGLDCAPCFARECRYGHTRCLQEIAPDRVHGDLLAAVASPSLQPA